MLSLNEIKLQQLEIDYELTKKEYEAVSEARRLNVDPSSGTKLDAKQEQLEKKLQQIDSQLQELKSLIKIEQDNSSIALSNSFTANSEIEQLISAIYQGNKPLLDRLMKKQIDGVYQKIDDWSFFHRRKALLSDDQEMWKNVLNLYAQECQHELKMFLNLCWYGSPEHSKHAVDAIKKWLGKRQNEESYAVQWQYVPSFFLLYLVGILSVHNKKWYYLVDVLAVQTRSYDEGAPRMSCYEIISERLIKPYRNVHEIPPAINEGKPIGQLMYNALRPLFMSLLSSEEDFTEAFDIFEFLLALYDVHIYPDRKSNQLFPRLGSPYEYSDQSQDAIASFLKKGRKAGNDWPILASFDEDFGMRRLIEILRKYQRLIEERRHNRSFPDRLPNYLHMYDPPMSKPIFFK